MEKQNPLTAPAWLKNSQYQTILRLTNTIAFQFDPTTGAHFVSPFISETLTGTYDDRQLSQVLLEDGVVHPDDYDKLTELRDMTLSGICCNEAVLLRLKNKSGGYKWYRVSICITNEGGQDYPIVVGTISDADEETRLREKQRWQSMYDDVTEIYNKSAFYTETEQLLHHNPHKDYSLILFDIDRFKMVNNLFGIKEGDKLLWHIGQIIGKLIKANETYGRIRDDVFCLCVFRTRIEILNLILELQNGLSSYQISFHLTLAIGIYHVEDPTLPISIMCDRASLALKTVKGSAVGNFAFYESSMGDNLAREQEIIGETHHAINTGQFKVYYQPKHRISDGKEIGAEALVRWFHPKKGIIPPSDFIELFERNGLIMQLDDYVWESVCQSLHRWIDSGVSPNPISVNVSRIHLYDPNLTDKLIALTEKYNISPSLLEIELTESAYVENPHLGDIMETLQTKGFAFLMDDFGSGYSSLNMLRSIPVDILKLDLNFLGFTESEPSGKIIMESIIQMAQRLNIPIIAEGVETESQAMFLLKCGCTMAQGYYYSKPMSCEDYESKYLHIKSI